ncbi:hypothetical protein PtA15_10A20 [Puccinia triticina]|uniref:Uncharacterized protein n=1 Tax=Puccinia triticina TaxID=208348 RepID=A0ABY7CWV8_9BASI|nr:uncharacterized protein PtA15_10A20 [Puccinia triticina]WAQ88601.1 hypothetical protein PtA15_10A20 [Puccinia triticina]WAR58683.1 hypothetical protein PtB15_10B21 [Puccinia triticina]
MSLTAAPAPTTPGAPSPVELRSNRPTMGPFRRLHATSRSNPDSHHSPSSSLLPVQNRQQSAEDIGALHNSKWAIGDAYIRRHGRICLVG